MSQNAVTTSKTSKKFGAFISAISELEVEHLPEEILAKASRYADQQRSNGTIISNDEAYQYIAESLGWK